MRGPSSDEIRSATAAIRLAMVFDIRGRSSATSTFWGSSFLVFQLRRSVAAALRLCSCTGSRG
jgi:hypothetical protein